MDKWESLIEGYSGNLRSFSKLMKNAEVLLKEDLAPFEIEWIIETLLYKPVELLGNISSNHDDDVWSNSLVDAFKLLEETVSRHARHLESHMEDIVEVCSLPYEPQVRKHALSCLARVARVSAIGARDLPRHVAALELADTCKTPLALLVGTICECHPEVVTDDVTRIWRIYLNMLECNKNTDTVVYEVLRGMAGLLKHFGSDLPTNETKGLYDKISTKYIEMSKCEEVCYDILSQHWGLFREWMGGDGRLRERLWCARDLAGVEPALRAVYTALYHTTSKERFESVIESEIVPHISSKETRMKYTALRVLTHLRTRVAGKRSVSSAAYSDCIDVLALEFDLRTENVFYDTAEAVCWCVEADLPGCERLIQTAILFYTNLPAAKRKSVVAHSILKSTPEVRTALILFLINETCQSYDDGPESTLDKYLPVWTDLFDSSNGTDVLVLENSRFVFEDFMNYLIFVLEIYLENIHCDERPPERIEALLNLASRVLTLQRPEKFTFGPCAAALPLVVQCVRVGGAGAAAVAAGGCACLHVADGDDTRQFYEIICIEGCRDEALLCESCLALIKAPDSAVVDAGSLLAAIQVVFSRKDVEPAMLSVALRKLESLMAKQELPEEALARVLRLVYALRSRDFTDSKDWRVLRRDILMFLGKYGNKIDVNNDSKGVDNTLVTQLQESLTLDILDPDERKTYKINLRSVLLLALEYEEPKSLQKLLTILYANLATKPDPAAQRALCRACVALAHAHARCDVVDARALQRAVLACNTAPCVRTLLTYISKEISPGVRKMLSNALEAMLVKEPASDATEELVRVVGEQAFAMMSSSDATTKRAGLDLSETLVIALKENNTLSVQLLPETLVLISKTEELNFVIPFKMATDCLIERIELFESNILDDCVSKLMENLLKTGNRTRDEFSPKSKMAAETSLKAYRSTVNLTIGFLKRVYDYKKEDYFSLFKVILDFSEKQNGLDTDKALYILAGMRRVLNLDLDASRRIVCADGFFVLNLLKGLDLKFEEDSYFNLEAILTFLREFSEVLLELQYEKTLALLGNFITKMIPRCAKHLHKDIVSCLSAYIKTSKTIPNILLVSFENWCSGLPVKEISDSIEREEFLTEHALAVYTLKAMLDVFQLSDLTAFLTSVSGEAQKWPRVVMRLYTTGYIERHLKSKMAYLTDILAVSLKFTPIEIVKRLMLEGQGLAGFPNEDIGLRFCRYFIKVFSDFLLKNPHIILDGDMAPCCFLLNDIVKYFVKRKCTEDQCELLLDLVDKLWPTYEARTGFAKRHSLLVDLACLPKRHGPESNPLQWVARTLTALDTSPEEKTRLVGVLPAGEAFSASFRGFASCLPTRLSEGSAGSAVWALVDALAATRDPTLLELVAKLAAGEEAKGWWDKAIDSCMASLAASHDPDFCGRLYSHCWEGLSLGVCTRMLVPLLRYSSSSFCERYIATIVKDLLMTLRKEQRAATHHYQYLKCLADRTRALLILQIAFEKIPSSSLESPNSLLYSQMPVEQSWYLVREICKLCVTFRDKATCLEGADQKLKNSFRLFLCACYTCQCAALCRRSPEPRYFDSVLCARAWSSLVDPEAEYKLPIVHRWKQRRVSCPVPIELEERGGGVTSQTRASNTLRTRMFLRTLSENPLQYDLMPAEDLSPSVSVNELRVSQSELNEHECAGVVSAVVGRAAEKAAAHQPWRRELVSALAGDTARNVKWLMAQVVCNCKSELKPYAKELRPALLDMIVNTACQYGEKKILNGLHFDVIATLTHWDEDVTEFFPPDSITHLNSVIEYVVNTCLNHSHNNLLHRSLVDMFGAFIDVYGSVIQNSWRNFTFYRCVLESPVSQYYSRLTKSRVYVPGLLNTLLARFESGNRVVELHKMAELFGGAMAACLEDNVADASLERYSKVLAKKRKESVPDYIKMLYYSQLGYPACCGDNDFWMAVNLVPKTLGRDKTKCLRVISGYVTSMMTRGERNPLTADILDDMDLCQLIVGDSSEEAMGVVAAGLRVLSEGLRRRLVTLVATHCQHSDVSVRKAAYHVMLEAFRVLLETEDGRPPAKRSTRDVISGVLKCAAASDVYSDTVLACLGGGVADRDFALASTIRGEVSKLLCEHHMGVRFIECFTIAVYTTATFTQSQPAGRGSGGTSASLSALLDLFYNHLKLNEVFKSIKLRDEPLPVRTLGFECSKLLSLSKTYQGTFGSKAAARRATADVSRDTPDIDVQTPVIDILLTLLEFSNNNPRAAETLCIEVIKSLLSRSGDRFDFQSELSTRLVPILMGDPSELTPYAVRATRALILNGCEVDRFESAAKRLKDATLRTEGRSLTAVLYKDVTLRSCSHQRFVLGSLDKDNFDSSMEDASRTFSLQDLTSSFGKLSDWEHLTFQQRRRVESSGLPPMWTDRETFRTCLDSYRDSADGWLKTMIESYHEDDKINFMKCLRNLDRWPRNHFAISAVVEALEWRHRQSELDLPCDLRATDCLAEWAARLMIRAEYVTFVSRDSEASPEAISMLSRSHELAWCERANDFSLPTLALDCVNRNAQDLYDNEVLPWLHQRLLALRTMGLKRDDTELLKKALSKADNCPEKFYQYTPKDAVAMNKLKLILHHDLHSLSKNKLDDTVLEIERHIKPAQVAMSDENRQALKSVYDFAMTYYDELLEESADETARNGIIVSMAGVLGRAVDLRVGTERAVHGAVLINALDGSAAPLADDTARRVLDKLQHLVCNLDEFALARLRARPDLFPARILSEYGAVRAVVGQVADGDVAAYRECLWLVCDAPHALAQYCGGLERALVGDDAAEWRAIFDRMRRKMFENPHAGSDYRLLAGYKERLYDIADYETTESFKSKAKQTLKGIRSELGLRKPQSTLRLSQLCPLLANVGVRGLETDGGLARLLALPPGVGVVRFYEQVAVFTDSIRRPTVVRALLTDGTVRRYMHKGGERLAADAAAQAALRAADAIWMGDRRVRFSSVAGYNVTVLSDDCALIEYLEDHERVRSLISDSYDLEAILDTMQRPPDQELILAPKQANKQQFLQICEKIPAYALRSSVEKNCASVQDFITKQRRFLDTLCSMTVLNWILGVGDRHLNNVLYSMRDGGVCCIDYGAILQYGGVELPPARLTRNLLALCDASLLESRLQTLTASLRDSWRLLLAVIKLSFKWMGSEFDDKLTYIRDTLEGKALSYTLTRDVVARSDKIQYKDKYIRMLDEVFADFAAGGSYGVEEQVCCLLRHCTDVQILSVTRSLWEPWV